ncbi:YDG domain-containing protein [Pseudomonas oryzihabitans]|uniref:YDG domain-containing protein n=1 Tax=Pseudomonas oryzihabitans TaxID=47885 RepID=UPI0011242FC1|nr:YDG domain-containing protein [Pseudomonas psychrotolerans]QDD89915.1 hypothetical protein CCZ28_13175 [Pseudomonas psychrotolerans]
MNRIFRTLWSHALQAWVVTSELAKSGGKRGSGRAVGLLLLAPLGAMAANLPSGGTVVSGSGHLSSTGQQLTVEQSSANLAIDWQSFDIGAGHGVTFHQPSSQAVALNRVVGQDASRILGNLDANGRVFLVNPNGILFGQGASVNVGGLVASTLDISNSDFEQGRYRFKSQATPKTVLNQGNIKAHDGGAVALLGGQVSNQGVIVANGGSVALAAGQAMTLDFAGDGLLNVKVDEATADALAENRELIRANGGQVLLTAHASDALLKTVVNNSGVIEAQTLAERGGKIELLGGFDGGTVQVAGTLDASAPTGGNGGFIETSGAHVKVADSAKVTTQARNGKTGTWLIDPNDFTIAASGGDMTGVAVSTAVQNNNFEIQTATMGTAGGNGDIHVNDIITWNSANTLTLNAERNININAAITAGDPGGKVVLKYGQASANGGVADYYIKAPINLHSGNNFGTQKGSTGSLVSYTVVTDANALQAMNNSLAGNYAVGSNIDLSSIGNWQPVGDSSSNFTGQFAGLGHTLGNLSINVSNTNYIGLFGLAANGSVIRDIGLVGGSISGAYNGNIGGLAGFNAGIVSNVYATLDMSGLVRPNNTGGLVGQNQGTISNAYSTSNVGGVNAKGGGLVGYNQGGTITNAYATGTVGSDSEGGGLVGTNELGTITNAYATGGVSGNGTLGGLVGYNDRGTISNVYATGAVGSTNGNLGGLVGYSDRGTISNAYATGNASGGSFVGGLVGAINGGSITYTYATGSVTSGAYVLGGLVGRNYNNGTINNSFYATTDAVGNAINDSGATTGVRFDGNVNGVAKTWTELSAQTTFTGWDTSIWSFPGINTSVAGYGSGGLPYLTGVTRPVDIVWNTLFAGGAGTVGSAYSITSWQQLANISQVLSGGYYFSLSNNLDQNSPGYTALASSSANNGAGWNPLGSNSTLFIGTFNGLGHTLSDLVINRSNNYVGLFGITGAGAVIRDIGLVGVSVSGDQVVGGLVGYNDRGTLSNAYATGSVSGNYYVGGLVGYNDRGTLSNAYATDSVSGSYSGGLVGYSSGTLSNVYATGSVSGSQYVGGLLGLNVGTLSNAYATGSVSGTSNVGGLLGYNDHGTLSSSFYATTDASGNAINGSSNGFGNGKSRSELTQASTYAGWDIASTGGSNAVWRIYEGNSGPLLRSLLTPLTVTATVADKVYDGSASSGSSYTTSVPGATLLGSLSYSSNSANAGTYSTQAGNLTLNNQLYSTSQGYDITIQAASLTITPKTITGSITAQDKTYDGTTSAITVGALSGAIQGDAVSLTTSGSFTDKNAGTGKQVNVSGVLSGSGASNYVLSSTNATTTANIAAKSITGTIAAQDKTYDGTTAATVSGSLSGAIQGDDVSLASTGAFTDKNAGTGKQVNVSGSLNGSGASNYVLGSTNATTTATITPKTLTGSITAQDKTYDGTTSAITVGALSGAIQGDTVSFTTSGSFTDKNVGNGKTVNVSGSLGGTDAGNYQLATNGTTIADITPAPLVITALDASKAAGQLAQLSGYNVTGLFTGDSVANVVLASPGANATAAPGSYLIVPSAANGLGLGNYLISYNPGTLTVQGVTVPQPVPDNPSTQPVSTPSVVPPVIAAQVSSTAPVQDGQTGTAQPVGDTTLRLTAFEELNGASLSGLPNLKVVNRGIRLPEGI